MFLEDPFIEVVDHWVTVWVGSLDEQGLENYLEEKGGAGDDEPISAFCEDLGRWYDHDFIWMEGSDKQIGAEGLCEKNGIDSQSLKDEIITRSNGEKVSSMLLLWNSRILDSKDVGTDRFAEGKLRCLGSWEQESPLTDF